jgi:hypothetical protein
VLLLRTDVAALYVDARGPYPGLVADWYDEDRNAAIYRGALPVVAHPPCGPWGHLRHLNRFQPKHCAAHALIVVRRVGGVLEHPAGSKFWVAYGLPLPRALPDAHGGWTLEIDQCRWGHVARKLTWLYIVGCASEELPAIPPPREPTHWVSGSRRRKDGGRAGGVVPAGIKVCSAEQRRRTPPAFAKWLLEVAARCRQ